MQAALMIRSKKRIRRKDKHGRIIKNDMPSNVATKDIPAFPRYPPNSWCAQGKAAWQEAAMGAAGPLGARRCSVVAEQGQGAGNHRTKQTEAHLRWMKRNRIHDSSYGGSSSDEEDSSGMRVAGASGGVLYVGLGTVALGLVISFVGTGDKGFKTYELRLAGPALIAAGMLCIILHILLCLCPVRCRPPRARARTKEPAAERLLLTERVPLPVHTTEPPTVAIPLQTQQQPRRLSIAASALLLENEREVQQIQTSQPLPVQKVTTSTSPIPPQQLLMLQQNATSPIVANIPLVMLSEVQTLKVKEDSLIELQTMDESSFDISSISSSEISVDNLTVIENAAEVNERMTGKLSRAREPLYSKEPPGARRSSLASSAGFQGSSIPRTVTFADTPNIIAPPSEAPPPPAEIVLTPSKLGQ